MTRSDPGGTFQSDERSATGERGSRTVTVDLARGQSTVLGVVLMIGLVGAMAAGILLVASDSVHHTTQTTRDERVKGAFVQFDEQVTTAVRTDGDVRTIDFALDEGAIRKQDTGRIVVTTKESGHELVNRSIGSVVYDGGGESYAYQAGGVWQGEGAGATVVSSPEIEYRQGTLVFPITTITGPTELPGDRLRIYKRSTTSPLSSPTVVSDDLVTIRITSEYYGGWAEFFRSWTNDAAVEEFDANQTVIVELGRPEIQGDFSKGVLATGGNGGDVTVGTRGNASVDGPVSAEGAVTVGHNPNSEVTGRVRQGANADLQPLDTGIRWKIDEARTSPGVHTIDPEHSGWQTKLHGGHTYLDEDAMILDNGTLVADLSTGNVTLLVDGDITAINDSTVRVENQTGNTALRVYATGDYSQKNSEVYVAGRGERNAEGLQIYGTSTMQVGIGGGGTTYFEGTIYAPRYRPAVGQGEDNAAFPNAGSNNCVGVDTCIAVGSPTVVGAIVTGPVAVQQSAQFTYDPGLRTVKPTLQLDETAFPPPITYLHVSLHDVVVEADE